MVDYQPDEWTRTTEQLLAAISDDTDTYLAKVSSTSRS